MMHTALLTLAILAASLVMTGLGMLGDMCK